MDVLGRVTLLKEVCISFYLVCRWSPKRACPGRPTPPGSITSPGGPFPFNLGCHFDFFLIKRIWQEQHCDLGGRIPRGFRLHLLECSFCEKPCEELRDPHTVREPTSQEAVKRDVQTASSCSRSLSGGPGQGTEKPTRSIQPPAAQEGSSSAPPAC